MVEGAILEEMKGLYQHQVYDKVDTEEYLERTDKEDRSEMAGLKQWRSEIYRIQE